MRLKTRRHPNGTYYVEGTGPDGKRIRKSLKTTDARRAEEARANLEARLWKVAQYGAEAVVTFAECAVAYAEDGKDARFLVKVAEELGPYKLREITPKLIRDTARKLYPTGAPATLNRQAITPAQAVINYGAAQGWCQKIGVPRFKVPKPKRVAVGVDYIEALRPHLSAHCYALMLFLSTTGRRIGEALALRPEDRHGDRVDIPNTKNGEPSTAYLTADVAAILDAIGPRHGRLFGYLRKQGVYRALQGACAKAGLPYLGTHQVGRHGAATALRKLGWGPREIADAVGWKSVRLMEETYVHSDNAAQKAAGALGKNMAKSPAKDGGIA